MSTMYISYIYLCINLLQRQRHIKFLTLYNINELSLIAEYLLSIY